MQGHQGLGVDVAVDFAEYHYDVRKDRRFHRTGFTDDECSPRPDLSFDAPVDTDAGLELQLPTEGAALFDVGPGLGDVGDCKRGGLALQTE